MGGGSCGQADASVASCESPETSESPRKPLTIETVYQLIERAVAEVARMDEETEKLEGWARLLIRCDSLVKKIAEAVCALGGDISSKSQKPRKPAKGGSAPGKEDLKETSKQEDEARAHSESSRSPPV